MKTFSLNQMMLKLSKQNKNYQRNKEKQKVNVVNNKKTKNQQIPKLAKKKKNNWTKKIKRKTEIDYSKKRVRKEVLDEMRYNYLKSVRKYMNKKDWFKLITLKLYQLYHRVYRYHFFCRSCMFYQYTIYILLHYHLFFDDYYFCRIHFNIL